MSEPSAYLIGFTTGVVGNLDQIVVFQDFLDLVLCL